VVGIMTKLRGHGRSSNLRPEKPGATVLVVEDEAGVRAAIRRLLQSAGYSVLEAEHGSGALELLKDTGHEKIQLVLTDLRMPVMDGRQLAAAMARLYPTIPIVFMSGYTAQLLDLRLVCPDLEFLPKPFRDEELLAAVRRHISDSPG
jgi:two-component system cell cycle sensor histidine kinase/response regulator CckA